MNEVIIKQLVDFKNYLKDFYGEGGCYAKKEFATETQIQSAIFDYCVACSESTPAATMRITGTYDEMTWGDGDSLDRERVAAILIDKYDVELY